MRHARTLAVLSAIVLATVAPIHAYREEAPDASVPQIERSEALILDGEPDDGRHPYVVHLVSYQTTREGATGAVVGYIKGFCTGFAVTPLLVVTAGHCTVAEQPGDVNGDGFVEHRQIEGMGVFLAEDPAANPLYSQRLGVGPLDEAIPSQRLGFDAFGEAIPHPFYTPEYHENDFPVHLYDVGVVAIRPETPLDLDRYAQLPGAQLAEDLHAPPGCTHASAARCTPPWLLAVGYGHHDEHGHKANETSPRSVASVQYEGIEPRFEERYFAVRGGIDGHDEVAAGGVCFGDSGGPFLLDGTDTVLGLVATGPEPCDGTALGHRIDIPDILAWIRGHMEADAPTGGLGIGGWG